ncbi:MAG: hypothetical protein JJ975_12750 [Bacteroidia bacterium]|nr:hypothetical protein [Bacteroidia bacterium]
MSKFLNVCVVHTKTVLGEEKTTYNKVGVLKISENGGMFLKLYHKPHTEFRIFANQEDELPIID